MKRRVGKMESRETFEKRMSEKEALRELEQAWKPFVDSQRTRKRTKKKATASGEILAKLYDRGGTNYAELGKAYGKISDTRVGQLIGKARSLSRQTSKKLKRPLKHPVAEM
jgi:hypothetical protein